MHLYLKVIDMHQRISDFPLTRWTAMTLSNIYFVRARSWCWQFRRTSWCIYIKSLCISPGILYPILTHTKKTFFITIDSSVHCDSLTYARSNQIHRINSTLFSASIASFYLLFFRWSVHLLTSYAVFSSRNWEYTRDREWRVNRWMECQSERNGVYVYICVWLN